MSENDMFIHVLKVGQSDGQANAPLLPDLGCCKKSPLCPVGLTDVTRSGIMGTDLRHIVQSGYPPRSYSDVMCEATLLIWVTHSTPTATPV